VLYPGSIERTSYAEKDEAKGYLLLEFDRGETAGGVLKDWEFCTLPARPMVVVDIAADAASPGTLGSKVKSAIAAASADAVLRLRIHGDLSEGARAAVTAANLRAIAPPTMNVEVRLMTDSERHR
jgi:DNA repair exonuclease SbcCD nuclease subunit